MTMSLLGRGGRAAAAEVPGRRRAPRPGRAVLALALTLVLALAGCGSGGGDEQPFEMVGMWRLIRLDVAGDPPLVQDRPVTLEVSAEGNVGGSSACNRYFGVATVDGASVRIGDIGSTLIGCFGVLMTLERAYLTALGDVERGERDGSRLTLTGPDARLVFVLESE